MRSKQPTAHRRLARHARLGMLAVVLSACSDGTSPNAKRLSLEIRANSVPAEEETIEVGRTLRLTATVVEASGKAVDPPPRPRWRSDAPDVATVGDTSGVVTGVRVGSARIIATAGGYSDTVLVNVAVAVESPLSCANADQTLQLKVGEAFVTTGDRAATLCLGTQDAEYVYVPFNGSEVAASRLTVDLTAVGTLNVQGPPTPNRVASSLVGGAPRRDTEFHDRVRTRASRMLEPRMRSTGLSPSAPSFARVPAIGEILRLNVETGSTNGCADPDYRFGRVEAVSTRAIVVADTANPRTSRPEDALTTEDYRHFAETFDTLVWRVNTQNFGEPSDIDDNDRVIIFITRAVNELTEPRSSSYIGGFFYNRDLFPRSGANACTGSNAGEVFYIMAPDPAGVVNENRRTRSFVRTTTVGVLAHEFQHLINDSRRLYVSKAPVWEETWLNEGLSHIAEELVFFAVAGIGPGANIGADALKSRQVADAFIRYNTDNLERLILFLEAPAEASLIGSDGLTTRGAIWSFLRYAADRLPGEDAGVWRDLVNSRTQGLENLQAVLGANPREWMRDWAVALYTDDAVPNIEPRFRQPTYDLRRLIPTLQNEFGVITHSVYPLGTVRLGSATQLRLQGGGTAYVRFRTSTAQSAVVRTLVGRLPAPSRLKVAIVRTK